MRLLPFLPLSLSLICAALPLRGATPPSAPAKEVWEEDEELKEEAESEKAIAEALQLSTERIKAREAWLALPEEQRKKETERKARVPLPGDGYDWRTEAAKYKLNLQDQAQLERQKFAIGSREYRQSFEPYEHPQGPVFITSDSLLNVYHVLFEETFRELEIRRAGQLKTYLEAMLTNARQVFSSLPYPTTQAEPALRHAQLSLAPALRLLGTPLEFFDAPLRKEIEMEVARIKEAKEPQLPEWLQPSTPDLLAIDYTRLQPVGFYVGSSVLENYFRAVRWLQLIPFRIERDNELGAIALLGAKLPNSEAGERRSYLHSYNRFLGQPDGRVLDHEINIIPQNKYVQSAISFQAELEAARVRYKPSQPTVKDNMRLERTDGDSLRPKPFHLLAAYALPESAVFQKLIDRGKQITGLQFAALNGSQWAYAQLAPAQKDKVLDEAINLPKEERRQRDDTNLYAAYRRLIASLFEKPDPDAPPFIASDAWSAKSSQTALASWAQMRHTFTLQAKISYLAAGVGDRPPGFIEPNPAFLRAYVNLVQATKTKLGEFKIFELSGDSVALALSDRAALCDQFVDLSKRLEKKVFHELTIYQKVMNFVGGLDVFENIPDSEKSNPILYTLIDANDNEKELVQALPRYAQFLRSIARQFKDGNIKVQDEQESRSFKTRWNGLEQLANRLETLLQKQLRKQDWNEEEAAFIQNYGEHMAYLMGYFGNAHLPQDDSPRWVEIANYPDRGTLFAVATGRPREFYVLYPWHGMDVLCTGSVFPYFEYEGGKRLTDAEWTQTLNQANGIPTPNWTEPLYLEP